jgi:hypothetical protein
MAAQIAAHQEPPRKRKQKAAARQALERYLATCHPGLDLHRPESPYPEENVQRTSWRWGFVRALNLSGPGGHRAAAWSSRRSPSSAMGAHGVTRVGRSSLEGCTPPRCSPRVGTTGNGAK